MWKKIGAAICLGGMVNGSPLKRQANSNETTPQHSEPEVPSTSFINYTQYDPALNLNLLSTNSSAGTMATLDLLRSLFL